MWDLLRPGLEPVSSALAGRFSTTAPPGKPLHFFFILYIFLSSCGFDFSYYSIILLLFHWDHLPCILLSVLLRNCHLKRVIIHGKTLPMLLFCSLIHEWGNFIQYLCFPTEYSDCLSFHFLSAWILDEYPFYPNKRGKDVHSSWTNLWCLVGIEVL